MAQQIEGALPLNCQPTIVKSSTSNSENSSLAAKTTQKLMSSDLYLYIFLIAPSLHLLLKSLI